MAQPSASLRDIVAFADHLLSPARFRDWDGAQNGLQFESRGPIRKIGAAVDGTLAVARMAIEAQCDLLVVHHGLFWGKSTPWTGRRADLIRCLVEADLAVYSQHLPLDAHPRLGNAAGLAKALGFRRWSPFFAHHDEHIGVQVRPTKPLLRTELAARLTTALGTPPRLLPGGPEWCHRIGICTGGAGAELQKAASEGVDTFITGEGPHWTFALAEEAGINTFYGGHYATETFGVRALSEALSRKFGIPWTFLDHPTGL